MRALRRSPGIASVVGRVVVVRREDRVAPLVVARVDDQVHRLFDPLGGLLRPEVVEDEQIRLHHRTQDVHLRGAHERVVGAADDPQQIARVVEEAARALRRGSRWRSTATARCVLPMPGGPIRQSPFCALARELARRTLARWRTASSSFSFGIGDEGVELAVAGSAAECARPRAAASVSPSRQQSQRTTRRTPSALDGLPAGVVAERAGHRGSRRIVARSGRRTAAQRPNVTRSRD